MTGRIIPLHGDPHERVIQLLPWFVTGRLDAGEQAEVEAHLGVCESCRAEERMERRLEAEVSAMPLAAELGWTRMRERLNAGSPPARERDLGARVVSAWRRAGGRRGRARKPATPRTRRIWLGVAVAVQAALMLLMLGVVWPQVGQRIQPGTGVGGTATGAYHALGASPTATPGNALIIFQPDTPERNLRAALMTTGARVVDGPTAAGAYVLHVPAERRAEVLATLSGRPDVVMVQPIDPGVIP